MCSSGVAAASTISCAATPEPDALSLAPGTSSPRSSRSASTASERARPPIAAGAAIRPAREPAHAAGRPPARAPKARERRAAPPAASPPGVEQQAVARRVHVPAETDASPLFAARRNAGDDVRARLAREEVRDRRHAEVALEHERGKRCARDCGARPAGPSLQQTAGQRGTEHARRTAEAKWRSRGSAPARPRCHSSPSHATSASPARRLVLRARAPGPYLGREQTDDGQRRLSRVARRCDRL